MPPRNASVPVEVPVGPIAEITIPQAERESVDNDFFIINRYVEGPLKAALLRDLPKGTIKITITRE